MKRKGKWFLMLLTCLTVAIASVSLASCSLLVGSLEDIKNNEAGSGSTNDPGNTSVTRTFELNVAEFGGDDWYNNVVDTAMWKVTASIDAYAKDTLVLNPDGSYELTKEMGAGPDADARWGKPGESTVSRYTYYGTYTTASDGVTVTLSECTALAVFVSQYSTTMAQMAGQLVEIPDTGKITDFTQTAGTQGNEILAIELLYGPYIVVSGYGNCSQQVKLEATEYGTFTFIDNAPTTPDTPTTPDVPTTPDNPGEPEEPDGVVYEFIATENGEITFVLNSDGTYTYTDGDVTETGAYAWSGAEGVLTLTTPDEETVASTLEGNLVKLTYTSGESSQSFVGSLAVLNEILSSMVYAFEPTSVSEGNSMSFELYYGGVWKMSYSLYGYTGAKYGTWWFKNGELHLAYEDGTEMEVEVDGEEVSFYFSAGMTQTFVGTVSGVLGAAVNGGAEKVYSFDPTSVSEGNSMAFDLYEGGVWEMSYSLYGYTGAKYGTWWFENGELHLAYEDGTEMEVVVDGEEVSFYFSAGMTQTFVGTVSGLDGAMSEENGGNA